MKRTMKAQGDLLFIPIRSVPKAAKPKVAESGRIILARGEVTGHHHSIPASGAVLAMEDAAVTYLTLEELVEVQHQEHAPVVLEPGSWEVRRQREYDWDEDEIRAVTD